MTHSRDAWRERIAWTWQAWPLLGGAAWAALVVEAGLRSRSQTALWHWAGCVPHDAASVPEPELLAHALRASRWAWALLPVPRTCLRECLVAARLLSLRGSPVTLQLGVRKTGVHLASHAWLEDGMGRDLTDPLADFAPLAPSSHDRSALPDPAR